MKLQKQLKEEILQIELRYLQLLCIQETINSLEHTFGNKRKVGRSQQNVGKSR